MNPNPGRDPRPGADGPFPDPRTAVFLTIGAIFATGLVGVFFFDLGPLAAVGIGQAIAVGAIATSAAQRVAEPQAERLGMRALDLEALPLVLCLAPAVLVASELDNIAADWTTPIVMESAVSEPDAGGDGEASPLDITGDPLEIGSDYGAPEDALEGGLGANEAEGSSAGSPGASKEASSQDASENPLRDPWTLAQALVIFVGIAPIVEEFFFRGVLQQSLVARLGLLRGVAFVAMLYTLFHLPAPAAPSLGRILVGFVSAFGMGCLLGFVRIATGSILGSMLLASLWASVGILSYALVDRVPLPGMNIDGTHLPVTIALASFALVGWAGMAIYREAALRHPETGGEGRPGGRVIPFAPRPSPTSDRSSHEEGPDDEGDDDDRSPFGR